MPHQLATRSSSGSSSRSSTQMQMPILMHLCSLSTDPLLSLLLLLLLPSPPQRLHIFICQVFNGFDRRCDVPRWRQQHRQRQRHRLLRCQLAGILGLRQVQINSDNSKQTTAATTTTTSRCCTLCKQRETPKPWPKPKLRAGVTAKAKANTKLICQSLKTAKVAHTFRWHLKVI